MRTSIPRRRRARGFTLTELLIVIAVIGILAAILLPALARAREQARRASCLVNLNQIGMALRMYADEHDRALPWSGGNQNADGLFALYANYLPEGLLFICPSDANADRGYAQDDDESRYLPKNAWLDGEASLRTSYDYFGAYTKSPLRLPHPSRPIPKVPIMWDLGSGGNVRFGASATAGAWSVGNMNHVPGGGNILWMDGSVSFLLAGDWADGNLPVWPEGIDYVNPSVALIGALPGTRGYDPPKVAPEKVNKPVPVLTPEQRAANEANTQQILQRLRERRAAQSQIAVEEPGFIGRGWKLFKRYVLYMN